MEIDESVKDEAQDKMTILMKDMFDHIAHQNVHFKSQQLGDPDLTFEEKSEILKNLYDTSQVNFLSRFGEQLLEPHIRLFEQSEPSYEIQHYLNVIKTRLSKGHRVVRNRRLEALKRLALEGDYFSKEEMRKRNPLLFEQLVGQYLTQEERLILDNFEGCENKLSSLLLEQFERDLMNQREKREREYEDDAMEEEDSDSDEEIVQAGEASRKEQSALWGEHSGTDSHRDISTRIPEEEKSLLYEEFCSQVYSDFIQGKDSGFDYSQVDHNTDYDDLDELNRDEEDKYFQNESPESIHNGTSNGIESDHIDDKEEEEEEEEDPLDAYMKQLNSELEEDNMNSKMKHLCE